MEQQREFKGIWIDRVIWLDERLSALDKCIFAEIDSYSLNEKGCYASNKYLAEFCQCSERQISQSVSKLIKCGYLQCLSFNGRQRVLQSRVANFARQGRKFCEAEWQILRPINKEDKQNKEKIYIGQVAEIVAYLNDKLHTKYSAKSAANVRLITARLKDGYTVADFKTVVDKKCEEWSETEFAAYLRPQTLFGTKFDSYLNAPIRKKRKPEPNAIGGVEIERQEYSEDELSGLFTKLD
nr:MAG TPA: hypothetical protein [Caudoviricetes sp.]